MSPPPNAPLDRDLAEGSLWPRLVMTWEELLWPKVLTAAKLGLRPGRLGLAFLAVLVAGVLLIVGLAIDASVAGPPLEPRVDEPAKQDLLTLWNLYVALPLRAAVNYPVTTLVIGPVVLAASVVLLGAISRIVACEFSLGQRIGPTAGLRFAAKRWASFLGAVLGPLVAVWLLTVLMAGAGALLMRWPGLNLLGGLLYGLQLLAAAAAVLLLIGYALGQNLLVPALACEGTDAIDALQRVYSYIAARPLRVVLYLVLAALGLVVIVTILSAIVYWTIGFAAQSAGVWAGEGGRAMVWRGTLAALGRPVAAEATGTFGVGALLIRLWTLIPLMLLLAAWLSCGTAAMTVVYLALRRVCDGQDVAELWIPGMVESAMGQAMESRARAAAQLGTPQSGSLSDLDQADDR